MTRIHYLKGRGQHRGRRDDIEMRRVAGIWGRLHPGVPPVEIEGLGTGNYAPRHALEPKRKRVYL